MHVKARHVGFYRAETAAQNAGDARENLVEQGRLEERARGQELLSEYRAYVQTIPNNCLSSHINGQPPYDADTRQNFIQRNMSLDTSSDDIFDQLFVVFDQNPE